MGKDNKYQYTAEPEEKSRKEYTDFDDMKNIFQYTHRRMGLGFSEEQFGESAGIVKGITKKQLVGADFDIKKKKELDKKKREKELKQQFGVDDKSNKNDDKDELNDENKLKKGSKNQNNNDESDYDERESKTKQVPNKDKKRNFEVEIKTSKKKNKQKVFKII